MTLFSDGFRPFFLGAAAVAALHAVAWIGFLYGDGRAPAGLSPLVWHGHEMVFGFAAALVAGFLLTAVPNWAGRAVAGPILLAALFSLWLAPRILMVIPSVPLPVAQWLAAAFFPALAIVIAIPIFATRNVRNYQVVAILAALAILGVVLHIRPNLALLRGAMDVLLLLMVVIGARVIPFFTSRRMPELGVKPGGRLIVVLAPAVLLAVLAGWFASDAAWLPAIYAAAGVLLLVQLVQWKPWATLSEPMLWILHVGYLWLAIALFLRATELPPSVSLHALTMGGLGCLAIGMMTRVALGHSGRPIQADMWMTTAFALVALAVLPRLAFPLLSLEAARVALVLAGSLWAAGFAIYFIRFLPVMFKPRL